MAFRIPGPSFKLVIAGSRSVQVSVDEIQALLDHYKLNPTHIISGKASGVDRCGEAYAKAKNLHLWEFPAQWDLYGRSAGHRRNKEMAMTGDAVLLIWDGKSPGSAGMKEITLKLGKPLYEAVVKS
jgi:hypothetical protein